MRELARELQVNPATVSKAYQRLTDAGLLVVDAVFDSLTRMSEDLTEVEPAAATAEPAPADVAGTGGGEAR